MSENWPIRLFSKSVLKQRKFKEVTTLLGPTDGLSCLDIGADNGVISYLLRQRGGRWKSADLDEASVGAIRALVETDVYQISGEETPFADDEFDVVALVDFLEHIPDDQAFVHELYRMIKPGGRVIINVPHIKNSLLRKVRLALGQTDEKHGHLRPGYTVDGLRQLLGDEFTIESSKTYSKFFSELVDTMIVQAVYMTQRNKTESSQKGALVTEQDLRKYQKMFRLYSLIYPIMWLIAKLDNLLFFTSGYMLILEAAVNKQPAADINQQELTNPESAVETV